MEDTDLLAQLVSLSHFSVHVQAQRLKIEFAKYWSGEMSKPRCADPARLLCYGFKIYSLNDEDGIIQRIFRRVGTAGRSFVEFGVQNGFECNTATLLVEGWRGLSVEANSPSIAEMRAHFDAFTAAGALEVPP